MRNARWLCAAACSMLALPLALAQTSESAAQPNSTERRATATPRDDKTSEARAAAPSARASGRPAQTRAVEVVQYVAPADQGEQEAIQPQVPPPPFGGLYPYEPYALQHAYAQAYRAGRLDERAALRRDFNVQDMAQRKERLLSRQEQALQAGLDLLKSGQPERAIAALTLAARLDNGDPACRIHLAQARLALGHYEAAAIQLRRAMQLQPNLVYLDLRLARYYADPTDLDRYSDALRKHVDSHGADAEVHFLLGYLEFQRGRFEAAHHAFRRAASGLRNDSLTEQFLEITTPTGR